MTRSPVRPATPRVSEPDLPDDLEPGEVRRRADLFAVSLDDLAGTVDLAHASLEQCRLGGSADRLDLTGARLMDVEIRDLRTAELVARDASVRRLRVSGGRIGTLDLTDASLGELELRDVRIDYLSLGSARGEDILITGCTIRALDVPLATLTRVAFAHCTSEELDTRDLRAKDVDLRGLDVAHILGLAGLRGTTLSPQQVIDLAQAFAEVAGVHVAE